MKPMLVTSAVPGCNNDEKGIAYFQHFTDMFCSKYAIISLIIPQTQTHRYPLNSLRLVSFCT